MELNVDNGDSDADTRLQPLLSKCVALLTGPRGMCEKHEGLQTIRRLLCKSSNPPTDLIVKMGLIRPLIRLLDAEVDETLQFETAWILGNIAAGSSCHTLAVVAEGALKPLVDLLDSPHLEISHQALWAVGNIVADNGHFRDLALEAGLLTRLTSFLQDHAPLLMRKTAVWVLVNVCRTKKPCVAVDVVADLLPIIFSLMLSKDLAVRCDAIWCLVYLTENSSQYLNVVWDSEKVLSCLHEMELNAADKSVFGVVRLIGNLLSGNESHIEKALDVGCTEKLILLLDHPSSRIQQEALTSLTNIVSGLPHDAEKLLAFPELPLKLSAFLKHNKVQLQREAVWLVAGFVQNCGPEFVQELGDAGVVACLCSVLDTRDLITLRTALESIGDMLKSTLNSGNHQFRSTLEACGGFEKIEHLQHHDNEIIYQLAYEVLDLVSAEDDLDESLLARDAAVHKFDLPINTNRDVSS